MAADWRVAVVSRKRRRKDRLQTEWWLTWLRENTNERHDILPGRNPGARGFFRWMELYGRNPRFREGKNGWWE